MSKRILTAFFTALLAVCLLPLGAWAEAGTPPQVNFDLSNYNGKEIIISDAGYSVDNSAVTAYTGDYTFSGSVTNCSITISSGNHTITLINVTLTDGKDFSWGNYGIKIVSGTTHLILDGENTIHTNSHGGGSSMPIWVSEGSTLNINGNGTLNAINDSDGKASIGAAWNYNCGIINIVSGTINAKGGGNGGAAIGNSGDRKGRGTVNILGGIVNCTLLNSDNGSTGLGGNSVSITGGIVNSTLPNNATKTTCILNNEVYGEYSLTANYEVPTDAQLTVLSGNTLVIPSGITLTNNGTITNQGAITNNGILINDGTFLGAHPSGSGIFTHTPHYDENGICTISGCNDAHKYYAAESINEVFQITNAGNLFWFANYVNSGNASANAIVTQDIIMPDNEVWRGIGNARKYNGTFDGNGKTITGLTGTEGLVKDLSGTVQISGTVQNVILKDVNISRNGDNLGAIAGHSTGMVKNCYVSGSVTGSGYSVGGIVGWNQGGTIEGCIAVCSVNNTATTGGLVGSNSVGGDNDGNSTAQGKMTNCLYIGELDPEGDNVWGYKTQVFRKKDTEYKVINGYKSETKWSDSYGIDVYNVMIAYSVFQEVASQIATPAASVTTENTTVYHETVEDAFSNANGKTAVIQILETTTATGTLAVNGEDTHITLNIPEGKTLTANIEVEQGALTVTGSLNGTIITKNGSVTVKREDGSSTTTTEKTQDGVTTKTVVEKDKDDNAISSTQTVTQPDGSAVKTELQADGSKVVTTYDKDGEVTEKRTYPDKDKPAYILDGYKPRMIEDGGTFNGGVLVFRSDDEFCNFRQVTVNGEELSTDSYTAESGSIRVTLKVDYLNSLPSGSYTVGIVSTNGTAQGSFVIPQTSQSTPTPTPAATSAPTPSVTQAPASSNAPTVAPAPTPVRTSIPATGDSIPDAAALFLLSGAALAVMALRQRRQKNK